MKARIHLDIGILLGSIASIALIWNGERLSAIFVMLCLLVSEVSTIRSILQKKGGTS